MQIAIQGSDIAGQTAGEHSGHKSPHSPSALTGFVTTGTAKLLAGGTPVALASAPTMEFDDCCGSSAGALADIVHKIRVGGIPVQLVGDPTSPHNGTAFIVSGSDKIQAI